MWIIFSNFKRLERRMAPDNIKYWKKLFPQLEFLNMTRCEQIKGMPAWVNDVEKRGGAVMRPLLMEDDD